MKKGALYLIPSTLGDTAPVSSLPLDIQAVTGNLHYFIVEDLRTARRFLKRILPGISIDSLHFQVLNEHTGPEEVASMLTPVMAGKDTGLLSEAGLPCIADPGARLVMHAHEKGVRVIPLTGPSSIFLALMASGFNGQNFSFSGYLPIDKKQRLAKIKELESAAYKYDQTQIFIETPYRNQHLMEALIGTCQPQTLVCLAVNLTLPEEWIAVRSVGQWKKTKWPDIQKKPAVFLIYR
ncbi:MAG: SAM-dependent methyltransferase [Bacteroidales bacterium]|jgi:16S rRNA (cytidine1402-2'-O)-methyltransferase|nr:SAM-dependent methyltransferase [Bacteroidales bacterium]